MFFYQAGDVIDNFYFGLKGISAYVIPQEGYRIYSVIDPEKSIDSKHKHRKQLFQYFGIEDTCVNVAALCHDDKSKQDDDNEFLFSKNGFKMQNRRFFTVQCIKNTEVLTLSMNEIDRMKRDYPYSSRSLF